MQYAEPMKPITNCCSNLAIHTIIQLVWNEKTITRAELSRLSGFSRSTITANVDKLLEDGMLLEQPLEGQDKRKSLVINQNRGLFIGIELDADCCAVGACDIMGTLLVEQCISIDYVDGPDAILKQISQTIKALQESLKERETAILGIGVGLPSPVDFAGGYAVHPAFMPGWHHYPVGPKLEKLYACPVFVDNEVNTMAFGEAFLSEQYRGKDILFIKLGAGIGAGMIVQGSIYRGNSGMSGNIGHMRVDGNTQQCKCGKVGCLEAIAGGSALLKRAELLAHTKQNPFLQKVVEEKGYLQLSDLKEAIRRRDSQIIQMVDESAHTIGSMVGSLVVFYDPKAVVLGGNLCEFGLQYVDSIRRAIITEATPWIKSDFDVNVTKFGDSIGVIGSAMLCISTLIRNGAFVNEV